MVSGSRLRLIGGTRCTHALVLRAKILNPGHARATRQVVERSVSFAQRDGMLRGNVRKQFAEAPDSALVKGIARSAALEPERLQHGGIRRVGGPSREKEFQQVAASGAAEILGGGIRSGAATDAAKLCPGFCILSG